MTEQNIDKALTIYWKINGIEMLPGSKVLTIKAKQLYVLSNKPGINKNKRKGLTHISKIFEPILKEIPRKEQLYILPNQNQDLELVTYNLEQRRNLLNRSMSRRNLNIIPRIRKNISNQYYENQYYIKGRIIRNGIRILVPILIATNAGENYISEQLISEIDKIEESNHTYTNFITQQEVTSMGKINSSIEIEGLLFNINLEIMDNEPEIILGIKWLNMVEPWNLTESELEITVNTIKIKIKRETINDIKKVYES